MPEFWAVYAAMLTGGVILILVLKRPWESEVSATVLASICVLLAAQVALVALLADRLALYRAVLGVLLVAGIAGVLLAVTMPAAALWVVLLPIATAAVLLAGFLATLALLNATAPAVTDRPSL